MWKKLLAVFSWVEATPEPQPGGLWQAGRSNNNPEAWELEYTSTMLLLSSLRSLAPGHLHSIWRLCSHGKQGAGGYKKQHQLGHSSQSHGSRGMAGKAHSLLKPSGLFLTRTELFQPTAWKRLSTPKIKWYFFPPSLFCCHLIQAHFTSLLLEIFVIQNV